MILTDNSKVSLANCVTFPSMIYDKDSWCVGDEDLDEIENV